MAHGWSPEEIQFRHPRLTLGRIHSALAYYRDHEGESGRDIERRPGRVEEVRREVGRSRLVERLRAEGLLS